MSTNPIEIDFGEVLRMVYSTHEITPETNILGRKLTEQGKRVLLEVPLDESMTDSERTVTLTHIGVQHIEPGLVVYPFYVESLMTEYADAIYCYIQDRIEGHQRVLAALESYPSVVCHLGIWRRQLWADDLFHMTTLEKELFVEGVPMSVDEIKRLCR